MRQRLFAKASSLPQPLRFLIAGGFAAGVNWLVRFPLSTIMPFAVAVFIATMIGMTVGFGLYQRLVFPGSRRPLLTRLRDFVFVNLLSSVVVVLVAWLSGLLLTMAIDKPLAEAIAHALGIATGAVLNFSGHRSVTFGDAGLHAPTVDRQC